MLPNFSENNELFDYSKKEILDELNNVLSSDLFSRSSVLSSFLKFIVEETMESRTDDLKEYTIAVSALGKPNNFNPQLDAIVRIHAGRLRRLLKEYYSGSGKSDPIQIEVIKGTYVPVFRAIISNELNGAAVKRNKPIHYSRSKLTLAVLPFRNLCPNGEYQFFADGFGEELTRIFSNFQDIAVIAHHSTRKYASIPDDIRTIGADLGVHYIINGSVMRTSEEIRVNVGLVETMNGNQIWSQTYNHALNIDNLTHIQDQIIEKLCSILGGYYGFIIHEDYKTHQNTFINLDSFDTALWIYYLHMNYSQEIYNQTLNALEESLRQNPNYAFGLAMLSELYLDAYSLGYPTTIEDPVKEAYELAKRAIKIDPQCQHAYQQFGWANVYLKKKDEAIKAMEHCLLLNSSSVSTIGAIGFGMACVGEYKRAHILLTKSLDLNPHCPWWFHLGFFLIHFNANQYNKALEHANKIDASDVFLAPLTKAVSKAELGLTKDAQVDINILKDNYSEINDNLEMYLNTFLLDTSIIDGIINGVKKATVGMD